jgi:isocitrate dehydrogenase
MGIGRFDLARSDEFAKPANAMGKYLKVTPPKRGSKITVAKNGQLQVPDDPIVPFIQGDGIDQKTWQACQNVFENAVDQCYGNAKRLEWMEVYAGERGNEIYGPNNWLPEDTIRGIQEYKVCIKGPLTTPVGMPRQLDTNLRERLDLFARVTPVRHVKGIPSALKNANGLNITMFREHTENQYEEIEWKKGSPEAKQIINFINNEMNKKPVRTIRPDSSIGVKAVSATATKRVVRMAIEYALKHRRKSVTFIHRGHDMKYTEGFFRDWGYELARKEFNEYCVTEQEIQEDYHGEAPRGRIILRDRLAENVMQDFINGRGDYDVVATTNLSADCLIAVAKSSVGSIDLVPTAYIGAKAAIFQANLDSSSRFVEEEGVNPSSVLLAGVMLFEHLGWKDAAELIAASLVRTVGNGTVTPDVARIVEGAQVVRTTEFCNLVVDNFEEVRKSRVQKAMQRAASTF